MVHFRHSQNSNMHMTSWFIRKHWFLLSIADITILMTMPTVIPSELMSNAGECSFVHDLYKYVAVWLYVHIISTQTKASPLLYSTTVQAAKSIFLSKLSIPRKRWWEAPASPWTSSNSDCLNCASCNAVMINKSSVHHCFADPGKIGWKCYLKLLQYSPLYQLHSERK